MCPVSGSFLAVCGVVSLMIKMGKRNEEAKVHEDKVLAEIKKLEGEYEKLDGR